MADPCRRALLALLAATPPAILGRTARAQPFPAPIRIPALQRLRAGIDLEGTATAWDDSTNGPAGMAVEVGALIADGLDVPLELVRTTTATAVAELRAGRFDLLLNAPPLTIEVAREVLYADPYAALELVVVAPRPLPLPSIAALRGRRVAAQAGYPLLLLPSRVPASQMDVIALPDLPALAAALADRQVEAAIVTSPIASRIAALYPALEVKLTLGTLWLAPACRFGDHDLLQAVNTMLYIARQEGTLQSLHQGAYDRPLPRPPFF
ncbi:transporter substrate-binding domain-containing protein [Falsiroseomonas stagni]|uniref:ABC-type amino acid transport substrate-binding protein n=1 Tax=Falsiroseomonas stagni DSM 19981 TaxID=1123062 RepID=A0A1I4BBX1_9PROT|nr:transporter substrate-binding domain-containing protein [Falsiroseomonas stagni]SFK66284.1 ABC-type amino acid transport substrate-binding protein [Falsiroseomonas stagni DSM 19981]